MRIIPTSGKVQEGALKVKVAPDLHVNLFSFIQAIKCGWKLEGSVGKNGQAMLVLTHKEFNPIYFDRVIKAGSSILLGAKMRAIEHTEHAEETNTTLVRNTMSKSTFHQVTGHAGHQYMNATAKYYNMDLKGTVKQCISCSLEKIWQKNIPKENNKKSEEPGTRMYLDISSMRKPSIGGRKHWALMVDEATKYKKSFFMKKKSDQIGEIVTWLKGLFAKYNIKVKYIRCDNSEENKSLEKRLNQEGLGVIFEYTAPGTPQQNGVVERAFVTLMARARAMMNFAGFTVKKRELLWCEAAQTVTHLDNILVQQEGKPPPFSWFYKEDAKYAQHLRTFGEMAVIADTEQKKTRSKLAPRGKMAMLLGYSTHHAGDVYRFLNMQTNHVNLSRDV